MGLDIGSSSIKVVELAQNKDNYELTHFRMAPLPPEAIVEGAIMNAGAVVDTITELIQMEKIKTKDVATSLSGNSVIVKKIKLPEMTEEELEESIQWEAEQYIPFDITDVNLDAQILGVDEQNVGQMDVMLVAAKKEIINDRISVLLEAGLTPQIVDVDAFAVGNMYETFHADLNDDQTVVLVNIGANITNVNVIKYGITTFTRDITIGGSQYTDEIQKQLNVSYEEAEALKLGGDLESRMETTEAVIPQEVGSIIRSVSQAIAMEIQRSLDFFSATSADEQVSKIYLAGGTSKIPGLLGVIESKTGFPTEVIDPFQSIMINEDQFNINHIREVAPAAAVAVGLALRFVGDQ